MKKCINIFSVFIVFSLLFISCNNKEIAELNKKIDELSNTMYESLNNQTAIINRVIGENLPISVPDECRKNLETLKDSASKLLDLEISENELKNVTEKYVAYITTTPPWIQEEQSYDLFEVKYNIDYASLLLAYKKEPQKIDFILKEFENFILASSNYSKIEDVIKKYDEIFADKVSPINEKTSSLIKSSEDLMKNESATTDDYKKLLTEIDSQKSVLEVNNITNKWNSLIEKEENLRVRLSETEDKVFLAEYEKEFKEFTEEAKKTNFLEEKYISLQSKVPLIQSKFSGNHDEDDIILYEWKVFCELNKKLQEANSQIATLQSDNSKYDEIVIAQISSSLSYVNTNVAIIGHTKIIDTSSIVKDVKSAVDKLNKLQSDKIASDNAKYIADYDKEFNSFKFNVISGTYSASIYTKLQNQLSYIQYIAYDKYQQRNIELDELKLYSEIKESLVDCKNQISSMKVGESRLNNIKINSLNERLSSITYNLTLIKNVDVKRFENELKGLESELKNKIAYLEKNADSEQQQLIKAYNSKVITLLKKVNQENNRLNDKDTFKGMKKEEKLKAIINGRVKLLTDLEKVETGFLYPSVSTMYSQVYGTIWTTQEGGASLDTADQFRVLDASLTTAKWGLYDNF